MAMFSKKKDPQAALAADLDHARQHRDRLSQRLAKARAKVEEEKCELTRLFSSDADDAAIGVVQASHRGALDTAEHIADALIVAEQRVSELEKQLADLIDARERAATVARIEAEAKELTEAKAQFDEVCAKLAEISGRVGLHSYEARAVEAFMQHAPREIDAALSMVRSAMSGYIGRVAVGSAPSVISEPASQPTLAPTKPSPEVTGLIAMRPIAWAENNGMIRRHPRGFIVALPVALAAHAQAIGACLPPGQDRACQLVSSGKISSALPELADCVALDAQSEQAKQDASNHSGASAKSEERRSKETTSEPHSQFTPLDRGPAYSVTVPVR